MSVGVELAKVAASPGTLIDLLEQRAATGCGEYIYLTGGAATTAHTLTYGALASDAKAIAHELRVRCERGSRALYPDFAEQASQILALDLVITVDTAVANLAGALGARTWVAVPFIPDWRWGLTGNRTPWYPTVRVYRQPSRGDWRSVFRQMATDLAALDG